MIRKQKQGVVEITPVIENIPQHILEATHGAKALKIGKLADKIKECGYTKCLTYTDKEFQELLGYDVSTGFTYAITYLRERCGIDKPVIRADSGKVYVFQRQRFVAK